MNSLACPLVFCWLICLVCFVGRSGAQARTDPSEARALNIIFQKWNISSPSVWNVSGDVCSGSAVNGVNLFKEDSYNPAIKCDCGFNNQSTCHVTELKVSGLNVRGAIPQELATLTNLKTLILTQNFLNGSLPDFLGNLTSLGFLNLAVNAFTGPIPTQLGQLRKLFLLAIGINYFTGPLPAQLGQLTNLKELYIDSCGASGEIPSTFVSLKSLEKLWASDVNFTGNLPDFIGSLTSLQELRFQGNYFEGPIPSSYSSLTNLSDLRISDLSGDSPSSLDFINNMTSLKILILRNSKISGGIPSNMDKFQLINHLDLSFNNLTGQIPQSLFSLSSLGFLFLGNNSLSGTLPLQKNANLQNIDLSYNEISGQFPSWVSAEGLQLNLVANNFVIDGFNDSKLSPGLSCLQNSIPCNSGSPVYSSFAVNCGGETFKAVDGTVFENDTVNLGAASYYVTETKKWAVSNIGTFPKLPNSTYILGNLFSVSNTPDAEIFRNARQSPSSLRYYGLGLENQNYTIRLLFTDDDRPIWQSIGRRVFDIYVQGLLMVKDFDISYEARKQDQKSRTLVRDFTASVSNNFLEIHFFWAGKGTCCVPTQWQKQGQYGPLISAISVFRADSIPARPSKKKRSLVAGILIPIGIVGMLSILGVLMWRWRLRRLRMADEEELLRTGARPDTFSYSELRAATEDFSPSNKLGEGGFGSVYKGKLSDGRLVAVKQLTVASHQGKSQFVTEIATISAVQHRNLVKLHGCCIEGDKRLLLYEYLENKSLDQALFGRSNLYLDWTTRLNICLGTARGLAYLHEESRPRIIHRDVKASNILLDADLNPKLSDFGLAKLYDDEKTHMSTRIAGTVGYLAPEYALCGRLTEKADVFGFGVLMLEIFSGRRNFDRNLEEENAYLLEWAWRLHERNQELELMDKTLPEFDKNEAMRAIKAALLCTQSSPTQRPPMSKVVAMLTGDVEIGSVTITPGYMTGYHFSDTSSFIRSDASTSLSKTGTTTTTTTSMSNSQQYISHSSSYTDERVFSPVSPSQPMLHQRM
ncbi:putative LRR receptor-like serine/threonine-protein kinase [Acorus gramineus]|uniref:non-specific serine/threonine protein kinase n=1 Tax=Acorus gramineus TaxID=55184 RepID=A0AAV9BWA6_ACOGR|nr:putative LRR receptor-like serine/threonine-protein kinase [Acorus gramineus]